MKHKINHKVKFNQGMYCKIWSLINSDLHNILKASACLMHYLAIFMSKKPEHFKILWAEDITYAWIYTKIRSYCYGFYQQEMF